jgi:hypothetical protein
MWATLRQAASEGVVLGVKWGIALFLTLMALGYALSDYGIVRGRALNGQRAFEYLQQLEAQQKQAPAPGPGLAP